MADSISSEEDDSQLEEEIRLQAAKFIKHKNSIVGFEGSSVLRSRKKSRKKSSSESSDSIVEEEINPFNEIEEIYNIVSKPNSTVKKKSVRFKIPECEEIPENNQFQSTTHPHKMKIHMGKVSGVLMKQSKIIEITPLKREARLGSFPFSPDALGDLYIANSGIIRWELRLRKHRLKLIIILFLLISIFVFLFYKDSLEDFQKSNHP